jgi:Rieske Fe-S protein
MVSTGLVALVLIGLAVTLGGSSRTRSGVLVAKVGEQRNGDVLPITAQVPETDHEQVQVFVVRLAGGRLEALRGVSTHLGCRLEWVGDPDYSRFTNAPGVAFEDQCGGSVFGVDGSWCGGPAPRALDRFRSTAVDGELAIDLNDIVRSPRRAITSTNACSATAPRR